MAQSSRVHRTESVSVLGRVWSLVGTTELYRVGRETVKPLSYTYCCRFISGFLISLVVHSLCMLITWTPDECQPARMPVADYDRLTHLHKLWTDSSGDRSFSVAGPRGTLCRLCCICLIEGPACSDISLFLGAIYIFPSFVITFPTACISTSVW